MVSDLNSKIRLLVFEDSDIDFELMKPSIVHAGGFVQLSRARTMADGLEQLQFETFDALLLDLHLPGGDGGVGTFQLVRAACDRIPVVVLTGVDDVELALRLVRAGAQDYVVKEHLDGHRLMLTVRYAIERAQHVRVERELREAQAQFEMAREVQHALFPKESPLLPGYEIAARCVSADATGGDIFDFVEVDGGKTAFLIGDASGHGVPASLLVSQTRSVIRTLLSLGCQLCELLPRTQALVSSDLSEGSFVTFLLVCLDPESGKLEYTSAGQPAFLLDASGHVRRRMDALSVPVMPLDAPVTGHVETDSLAPDELLLMFTDGIAESHCDRKFFGTERMVQVVRSLRHMPVKFIVDCLIDAALSYSGGDKPTDDMTAIIVKRQPD